MAGQIQHSQHLAASSINSFAAAQAPPADEVKSISFKKYSECFSGIDKTRSLDKANEFYALNKSKFTFDEKCSPEFIKKTKEEFLVICQWQAGRDLFSKIFERYPKLSYKEYYKNGCTPSGQQVQLAPEEQYYYTYINENNEQELHFQPEWMNHVHEVIHLYMHDASRSPVWEEPTLGPEFHNMEEQIVITGFDKDSINYHPFNENLFHYLSDTPFRSSHEGVIALNADQPFSSVDCVNANALGALRKLKSVNTPQKINEKNVHPLTHACHLNKLKIVNYLIDNGADIKVIDDYGSPLHACVNTVDSKDYIQQLIRAGADVNCRDQQNVTPLMKAVTHNDLGALQALIEKGADVNCESDFKETPLCKAVKRSNWNIAKQLIEAGANVKHQDNNLVTPLMMICRERNPSAVIIDLVLKRLQPADINCKNVLGETALMIALELKNWDVAKRLIEAGADVKQENNDHETPLTIARGKNAPSDVIDLFSETST
jgi:ankyrin repeat protein